MQRSPQARSLSSPSSACDDLWIWQTTQSIPWLSCQLLQDWPHAFLTRHTHPYRPDQLAPLLNLGGDKAAWAHQVHGRAAIRSETLLSNPTSRPQADAVLTHRCGDSVWVCTADCVPILMGSTQTGQVAAIHAGWRGTAASICTAVMEQWARQGVDLGSVRVAIGPAISGGAYQVSKTVAEQVLSTLPPEDHDQVLQADPDPERVRLDLKHVNRLQLAHSGVPSAQISVSPLCTRQQSEQFFSYRRAGGSLRDDQGRSQVQWSGIGIQP